MNSLKNASIATAALLASAVPAAVVNAAEGDWEHTAILYGMGAAIDGTAQIGDVEVPLDLSISDVFDSLKMGAMGAYNADNGVWSFTADITYMNLGGSQEGQRGLVKGTVDMTQTTVMATVGRHVGRNFQVLASAAYLDLSSELKVRVRQPVTGDVTRVSAEADASWVDPLIGLQYTVPFADDWRFNMRGDIGGFGVGADLTYQLLANFRWQASDRIGIVAGYRLISFDYEDGRKGTNNYQRFDLTEQGPLLGVTISF